MSLKAVCEIEILMNIFELTEMYSLIIACILDSCALMLLSP